MQAQITAEKTRRFDWFYLVIAEFSLCNLGNYAVMAILSLFFIRTLNLPAAQAGGLLLFTSLSFRISRVLMAPLVDRLPIRQATFLSLFLTSAGYLGMTIANAPFFVLILLFIIGVGHSTNALLVKTMAAQAKSSGLGKTQSPFLRYASLTTGVNLAAAVGSVLGSTLYFRWSPSGVFLIAAITYAVSGIIATQIPVSEVGSNPDRPKWLLAVRLSLRIPALWRALLFAFMGWFLYTQSYASLPLFVSQSLRRPELLGSVFALNAILVVVGQLPISRTIIYLRLPTSQSVLLAFVAFAAGFALLWLVPNWLIVYAAVALWTLGEMLLMPALDTLVAEGALVEHKQVAFVIYSVAVGLGEGLGNLFGVSLAGFLLKSGSLSYLYTLLTIGALGAGIVTVFASKRNESMILRLLNGQSFRPTGQTQLLSPEMPASETRTTTQFLISWMGTGSVHDEINFLEANPEVVLLNTGQLNDYIEQNPESSGAEMLADRVNILRDIRSRVGTLVRESYVNMYGGLVYDLPSWLEETKQQLTRISAEGQPDQTALRRMTLLNKALERTHGNSAIAPEVTAELQVLYAIAALEVRVERAQAIEAAINSCEAALQVYTLARYPYQYARTQIFLCLAYLQRIQGERQANLENALACYQAAEQGYKSDPAAMQWAATQFAGSNIYAQYIVGEKLTNLQQAMAYCQASLQDYIHAKETENERTQRLSLVAESSNNEEEDGPPLEENDDQATLVVSKAEMRQRQAGISHVQWIAKEATQHLKEL